MIFFIDFANTKQAQSNLRAPISPMKSSGQGSSESTQLAGSVFRLPALLDQFPLTSSGPNFPLGPIPKSLQPSTAGLESQLTTKAFLGTGLQLRASCWRRSRAESEVEGGTPLASPICQESRCRVCKHRLERTSPLRNVALIRNCPPD